MFHVLLVGAGGALGAMGRYGLSLLPWRGDFPLLTLCVGCGVCQQLCPVDAFYSTKKEG